MDSCSSFIMPQTDSPLFSLPGELRNEIYSLSTTPSAPITNPTWDTTVRPKHQKLPNLSVALLQTCRAIYIEAKDSMRLEDSEFIFTRVTHAQAFFSRFNRAQRSLVRSMTIDLREAASGNVASENEEIMGVGNEWFHYLWCIHEAHPTGAWCSKLSTLKSDLPNIQSLCIDMTGWQPRFAGSRIDGWKYLRSLLERLRGLESFTIKGKCLDCSCWNPKPAPWSLGPWFSPAFSKDECALVELMGEVVRDEQEDEVRVFEWQSVEGVSTLGVGLRRGAEQTSVLSPKAGETIPERGSVSWCEFRQRWGS